MPMGSSYTAKSAKIRFWNWQFKIKSLLKNNAFSLKILVKYTKVNIYHRVFIQSESPEEWKTEARQGHSLSDFRAFRFPDLALPNARLFAFF
jgi:hypothetical protein